MLNSEPLTWEQVKPIWDTQLWPGRDSEPVTSMKYLGGYNMDFKKAEPYFIGIKVDDLVIAVNSYVPTVDTEWRSRGLWVHPDHRGRHHAKSILHSTITHVQSMGGTRIWTMPRQEALPVYESVGFVKTSTLGMQDWGTNCYALLEMENNDVRIYT